MEQNPSKALELNVLGTKILADLASKFKVAKFVMISTEKAVISTNVMGANKRLAEIYVQALNSLHENVTRFIVTRFSNVLGSNGSVIPLFKKTNRSWWPCDCYPSRHYSIFYDYSRSLSIGLRGWQNGKGRRGICI